MNGWMRPVLALLVGAILASCARDAMIDYTHVAPRLVIQGRLSPDTTFSISITSSLVPDDTSAYQIPEGVVPSLIDLNTNGVINLYPENGRFVAPLAYPQIGHAYKLYANAPGFKTAETTTIIPDPVELGRGEIQNLRLVPSELTEDKMNVSYDLKLNFKAHQHQYFHFNFLQTTRINFGTPSDPDIRERAYIIEPQFPDEDGYYAHHETGILIDALKMKDPFLLLSFVDYTLGEIEELGELLIEVRTVTPEYYHYFSSLSRQLISREDPFAEPIPVYNNVRDGSGNFSGYSSLVYQIRIIP